MTGADRLSILCMRIGGENIADLHRYVDSQL